MPGRFLYKKNAVTLSPFTFLVPSIATSSKVILAMLFVEIVLLGLTGSFSSLFIITLTTAASVCCEAGYKKIKSNYQTDYMISIIQGILTGMLIPSNYPFVIVFLVSIVCFICAKYIFGGYSSSWINPSCIIVAVLFFLNSSYFPGFAVSSHALQTRNAALSLIQDGTIKTFGFDFKVTEFLNKNIFSFFKISIPNGYVSMFVDSSSIIPAFRFNLVTLVFALILISYNIINFIIPVVFISTYMILVRLLLPVFLNGTPLQGDMLLALLTSGTIFGTTFLLQWYGTIPLSMYGKVLYGLIAGALAFAIIGFGTSSTGFVFVTLLMNIFSPILQHFELKRAIKSMKRKVSDNSEKEKVNV